MHINDFQEPPFFVAGSIGPRGQTVQVIDEGGTPHSFHVTEALALLECRTLMDPSVMTERYGDPAEPSFGSDRPVRPTGRPFLPNQP